MANKHKLDEKSKKKQEEALKKLKTTIKQTAKTVKKNVEKGAEEEKKKVQTEIASKSDSKQAEKAKAKVEQAKSELKSVAKEVKKNTKQLANEVKKATTVEYTGKKATDVTGKLANLSTSNKKKIDSDTREMQNYAFSQPGGKFIANAQEGLIDATIGVPYSLITGKNLSADTGRNKYYEETHSGAEAAIGRLVGEAIPTIASFGALSGTTKVANAAEKVLSTDVGKKLLEKAVASKAGQKLGEKATQELVEGLVKDAVIDSTAGLGQNIVIGRGEGKSGTELLKDVAKNQAIDYALGGAIDVLPAVKKLLKNGKSKEALEEMKLLSAPEQEEILKNLDEDEIKLLNAPQKQLEAPIDVNPKKGKNVVNTYHGTPNANFEKFNEDGGVIWSSPNREYAEKYQADHTNPFKDSENAQIFDLNIGYDNALDLGDISEKIFTDSSKTKLSDKAVEIGKALGISEEELTTYLQDFYYDFENVPIWTWTETKDFKSMLQDAGYDAVKALEDGGKTTTYGVVSNDQIRNTNGVKYQEPETINVGKSNYEPNFKMNTEAEAEAAVKIQKEIDAQQKKLKKLIKEKDTKTGTEQEKVVQKYKEAYQKLQDLKNKQKDISNGKTVKIDEKAEGINGQEAKKTRSKAKSEPRNSTNFEQKTSSSTTTGDAAKSFGDSTISYEDVKAHYGGKTVNGKRVSNSFDTFFNSPNQTAETRSKMADDLFDNGKFTYNPKKNSQASDEAQRIIDERGFDGATEYYFSSLQDGLNISEGKGTTFQALAYKLNKHYAEVGDGEMASKVLSELCGDGGFVTEAARTLQMQRIWQALTPEGKVYSALRSMNNLSKEVGTKIEVTSEMQATLDAIFNATDEKTLYDAAHQFSVQVWNQIPASWMEKVNAYRYMAMLMNPKTHIRNILGNLLFMPVRYMRDEIARGIESVASSKISKLSNGEIKGSKANVVLPTKENKALRKQAKEEYAKIKDSIKSSSPKYVDRRRPDESPVFNGKLMEGTRKGNSNLLEGEDAWFLGANFDSAYAQYVKANGYTAETVTDEIKRKAVEYAEQQAKEATYRDANQLAEVINKFRRKTEVNDTDSAGMKALKTVGNVAVESIMPFTKTPLNILKRGFEYSAFNVVPSLVKISNAKTADELIKGIEGLSAGITGTGLMALGGFLASKGLVNGASGDWSKSTAYEEMQGKQDYAVNVGDYTYTMDWMSPQAMPFFVGVQLAEALSNDLTPWEIVESLSSITDPVFEMSMLSGVENVFNTSYSSSDNKATAILGNMATNYASQFVPTVLGQIARTTVDDRKTTLSTAETATERSANKFIDKLTNKIPVVTNRNQDYVDQWGRTDSNDNKLGSALENFLSPGYVEKKNTTVVDTEINRLIETLGTEANAAIPNVATDAYKVTYDGVEKNMTESEFTTYKKTLGQEKYKRVEELIKTDRYKNATDQDKVKMIQDCYDSAKQDALKEYIVNSGRATEEEYCYSTLSKTQQATVDSGTITAKRLYEINDIASRNGASAGASGIEVIDSMPDLTYGELKAFSDNVSEAAVTKYQRIKKSGLTVDEVVESKKICKEKWDKDGNGSLKKDEVMAYLSTTDYNRAQKWAILSALTTCTENPY